MREIQQKDFEASSGAAWLTFLVKTTTLEGIAVTLKHQQQNWTPFRRQRDNQRREDRPEDDCYFFVVGRRGKRQLLPGS